jgi:hypothetical protein
MKNLSICLTARPFDIRIQGLVETIHLHIGNNVIKLPTETSDGLDLLLIYRPNMGLGENLTPRGPIIIVHQPVRYLFEIPSLFFMEF